MDRFVEFALGFGPGNADQNGIVVFLNKIPVLTPHNTPSTDLNLIEFQLAGLSFQFLPLRHGPRLSLRIEEESSQPPHFKISSVFRVTPDPYYVYSSPVIGSGIPVIRNDLPKRNGSH